MAKRASDHPPIAAERVRELLHYDPSTGVFRWRVAQGKKKPGQVAGYQGGKYIEICLDRNHCYGHQLAWLYMTGNWPTLDVDHRDTNKQNNRWQNLRVATRSQNMANTPKRSSNTSGFKGVSWSKTANRWWASIKYDGKLRHLGYYDDVEQAALAYRQELERLFGEFAHTG